MSIDSAVKIMANILKLSKLNITVNLEDEPTITVELKDLNSALDLFKKSGFKVEQLLPGSKILGVYRKGGIEIFVDSHQKFGYFRFDEVQEW